MRHLLSNIISAFIRKKSLRDKVRTMIRYPKTHAYVRYVRDFARNMGRHKIRTLVGYGCSNFVVVLNNRYVFKFPLLDDGHAVAQREERITNALREISPIKIPAMKIIPYAGIYIRKYEFANGNLLTEFDPDVISKHREPIAKQIANFLYIVGTSDPREIRDLKPNSKERPGFLHGWNHGDIWQNFMIDPKTFKITFFIDWECANFGPMIPMLRAAAYHWDKFKYRGLVVDVMAEYTKLYFKQNGKK